MLDVFITVDVELWCDGWQDIDAKFKGAFQRYVYGSTPSGAYGLPYQLAVLGDHGLAAAFFVEPLFSARFGPAPLAEIVELITNAGQEVQLHLHTEWVDEALAPLIDDVRHKRQHLRYFSLAEQTRLISIGSRMLEEAGGGPISAFRAGSFGFNRDTLTALHAIGVKLDSSYNATQFGTDSGVLPGTVVVEPVECDGVVEYPMTVFMDGTRRMRHAQLTACSYSEMEGLLWRALEQQRHAFVILSHNFELLNRTQTAADPMVVERFRRLCAFLDRNRDSFRVRGFNGLLPAPVSQQPAMLTSPVWKAGLRTFEQLWRRRYR
jgi:hypothetical protein